jgi:hypothetical protein
MSAKEEIGTITQGAFVGWTKDKLAIMIPEQLEIQLVALLENKEHQLALAREGLESAIRALKAIADAEDYEGRSSAKYIHCVVDDLQNTLAKLAKTK